MNQSEMSLTWLVRSIIVDGVSVQSLQVPGKYLSWANQPVEKSDRLYTVFMFKLKNRKWIDESIHVYVECINSSFQIVWIDMSMAVSYFCMEVLHGVDFVFKEINSWDASVSLSGSQSLFCS